MRSLILAAILLFAGNAHATEAAAAKDRRPPDYPAACLPAKGEPKAPQSVTVAYDVSKSGFARNVRVVRSTDPCFNDASVAAVRAWRFEDGTPGNLETTFRFVFEEPTETLDFDASPLTRVPPKYPERCMRSAKSVEIVQVTFDVTPEGATENISVIESTNSCLEKSALDSVAKWRYRPKIEDGRPVVRKGVETTIVFELTSGFSKDDRIRGSVLSGLLSAQRKARNGKPSEALEQLAEIEADYAANFSKAELKAFHQVRAAARIALNDYAGALDDLRVVMRLGGIQDAEDYEKLQKLVAQLEAIVAQQSRAPAQPDAAAEPKPETE